ncbi:RecX family transcriptional regulator [Pedobacter sp.]|nr:RecX family transcriptional regulator [Candidatus Saccharibacteria bacterium]
MKITAISAQVRNTDRVNVFVDDVYRFSLDIFQLVDLGIKVGKDYTEQELAELREESEFGKLYGRALEYTMLRPHSEKEIRDYLWRKTRPTLTKEGTQRPGVSQRSADRVFDRLKEKGYVSDETFSRLWVENRSQIKGISRRKLQLELRKKGVDLALIEQALHDSPRSDEDELAKIIAKKRHRYDDEQKLIAYLIRQGFSYDIVKRALSEDQ